MLLGISKKTLLSRGEHFMSPQGLAQYEHHGVKEVGAQAQQRLHARIKA